METNNEEPEYTCEGCSEKLSSEVFGINDGVYCENCVTYCDGCCEYFIHTGAHFFDSICEDCQDEYYSCDECGEAPIHCDETTTASDMGGVYCDRCTNSYLWFCRQCQEWYRDSDNDECGGEYQYGINDYSFKPDPVFHAKADERTNTYFGFELEVEAVHDTINHGVEIVKKHTTDDLVYLKSDGSLNDGFEIVTHPMSHEFAMGDFPWQMLEDLRVAGFRSWNTDTCGLHVHVSRRAFADRSHLWKWTYLINKNVNECIQLAGRNSHYARFNGVKDTSDVVLRKKMAEQRYTAINLIPSRTVEVRIFKGSLRIPRVKTALDFMQSSIEFANKLSIKDASSGKTWDMFKDYVGEHAVRFENLNLRLNADKLVDTNA